MKSLSRVRLFVTPWTVAYQAPPSMGFSRQECCSGLPFPSPGDLPQPRDQTQVSRTAGEFFTNEPPAKPWLCGNSLCEVKSLSRVRLFVTPWTVAYQAPPSIGFSRQECWSELPFPSPGDLPDPGIEPGSPTLKADALHSEPPGNPTTKIFKLH